MYCEDIATHPFHLLMSEPRGNPFGSGDNPTDGSSVGLEGSFPIRAEHSEKHAQTLGTALSAKKNRNDNCNQLLVMIEWIKETYPDTADDLNPNLLLHTSTNRSGSSMETKLRLTTTNLDP